GGSLRRLGAKPSNPKAASRVSGRSWLTSRRLSPVAFAIRLARAAGAGLTLGDLGNIQGDFSPMLRACLSGRYLVACPLRCVWPASQGPAVQIVAQCDRAQRIDGDSEGFRVGGDFAGKGGGK